MDPKENTAFSSFNNEELLASLPQLKGKKVLILGDVGVDEYVLGSVRRISPEAPVPVLEVENEDTRLGLAGNVAQNVASLGGEALLVSVIGQDMGGMSLKNLLKSAFVDEGLLVVDFDRPTTKKTRIMAKHHHLVRVDYEHRQFLNQNVEGQLIDRAAQVMPSCDVVVIQDYAKGVVTRSLIERVTELAKRYGKRVLADPHRTNPASFYEGVSLIKPNFEEALALARISYEDYRLHGKSLAEVAAIIQKETQSPDVVITEGREGMTLFSNGRANRVPTYARQVFDVTGAGDTVIASLALALGAGMSLEKACTLANYAAGFVVGKVGCVACSQSDLAEYIKESDAHAVF